MKIKHLMMTALAISLCFQILFSQTKPTKNNKTGKPETTQKEIYAMPEIKEFGVFFFMRTSNTTDSSGIYQPPFKYGELVNIFFNYQPKKNEEITAIPIQADFEPINLKIESVKKSNFLDCNAEPPAYAWEVEFEKITDKRFLEFDSIKDRNAEYPFDFFVIYPKVKFAKRIKTKDLTKNMIPKGVYLNTVTGAVDLTNDGKPDLLEASYCCNNSKMSYETCDYTCGATYKKTKNRWKVVKYNSSCT
ncbi:MAG: hypothetical protein ACR2J3_06815 [Aridibacter sp.]